MNTGAVRPVVAVALATVVALAGAGCGGRADEDTGSTGLSASSSSAGASADASSTAGTPSGGASTDASAIPEDALVIDVEIEGDTVTPNAERLDAEVGQPIVFRITSDTTSELHGHASPEFSFDIEPGTSEHTVTFEEPASVTVELHDPDRTLVQIVVR